MGGGHELSDTVSRLLTPPASPRPHLSRLMCDGTQGAGHPVAEHTAGARRQTAGLRRVARDRPVPAGAPSYGRVLGSAAGAEAAVPPAGGAVAGRISKA